MAKCMVARDVTVLVIEVLEVVHIQHHESCFNPVLLHAGNPALERIHNLCLLEIVMKKNEESYYSRYRR